MNILVSYFSDVVMVAFINACINATAIYIYIRWRHVTAQRMGEIENKKEGVFFN